jgi:signal peptidase I
MATAATIQSSIKALVTAGVVLLAYWVQPYRPFVVSGESMTPSFQNFQLAVADTRLPDKFKRDQVVLIKVDGVLSLKRIAYVGGDHYLRLRNPTETIDLIQVGPGKSHPQTLEGVRVPNGSVYVVGDNLFLSRDSRDVGVLPESDIVAWLPNAPKPPRGSQTIGPYTRAEARAYGIVSNALPATLAN